MKLQMIFTRASSCRLRLHGVPNGIRLRLLTCIQLAVVLCFYAGCGSQAEPNAPAVKPDTPADQPDPSTVGPAEDQAVRMALEEYKRAILNDAGETAVRLVTHSTLELFEEYRMHALSAPRPAVEKLAAMDRLMVLLTRHRIPAEQLRTMNGRTLFVHGVNNGWVGKQAVSSLAFGDVTVSDDLATVVAIVNGAPIPFKYELRKEEGGWRVNLKRVIALTRPVVAKALQNIDEDENIAIFRLIELVTGERPTDALWQPPDQT